MTGVGPGGPIARDSGAGAARAALSREGQLVRRRCQVGSGPGGRGELSYRFRRCPTARQPGAGGPAGASPSGHQVAPPDRVGPAPPGRKPWESLSPGVAL